MRVEVRLPAERYEMALLYDGLQRWTGKRITPKRLKDWAVAMTQLTLPVKRYQQIA